MHKGRTASSGHYFAFVRHSNSSARSDLCVADDPENPWQRCNDGVVTQVKFDAMCREVQDEPLNTVYIMVFKRIAGHDGDGAAAHDAAIVDATVVAIGGDVVTSGGGEMVTVDAEVVVVDAHIVDACNSVGAAAEKRVDDGERSSSEEESDDDDAMDAEERAVMAMAIALSQQDAADAASNAASIAPLDAASKSEEHVAPAAASASVLPPPPPAPLQAQGEGHAPQAPLRFVLTHEEQAQLEREVEEATNAKACVRNLAYLTDELSRWSSPHWLAEVAFDARATLAASAQ